MGTGGRKQIWEVSTDELHWKTACGCVRIAVKLDDRKNPTVYNDMVNLNNKLITAYRRKRFLSKEDVYYFELDKDEFLLLDVCLTRALAYYKEEQDPVIRLANVLNVNETKSALYKAPQRLVKEKSRSDYEER